MIQSSSSRNSRLRLLHIVNKSERLSFVQRVSVAEEKTHFAHRGDPRYIVVERDDVLCRNIVRVKEVCWLELSHVWKAVQPGSYQVSIRLKLGKYFTWPSARGKTTKRMLSSPTNEIIIPVDKSWWMCLNNNTPADNQLLCLDWDFDKNKLTGWIEVKMPKIKIQFQGDISFKLSD